MFTTEELNLIDPSYFNIIQAGVYSVTLQSRNTGHYWHILCQEGKGFSTCQIYHKHNYGDEYHLHRNRPSLETALKDIHSHDTFHAGGRKRHHTA